MWRMPLWRPYRKMIDSKVADINNVSESPHAGAITAALYLQEFVDPGIAWAHLDVMAWNTRARPGRPEGAEAQPLRALYSYNASRFEYPAPAAARSPRWSPIRAGGRERPGRRRVRRG